MSIEILEAQLDRLRLLRDVDAERLAARRAALDAFARHGFPGRRLEDWRYTDMQRIDAMDLDFVPPPPGVAEIDIARAILERVPYPADVPLVVIVDGHPVPELCRLDDHEGLSVETGSRGNGRDFGAMAATDAAEARHALAALNAAFASTTGIRVGGPHVRLTILVVAASDGIAAQLRLPVSLAAGCSASVNLHVTGADGIETGWTSIVTDIEQEPGSRLDLIRLQELPGQLSLTTHFRARLGESAKLALGTFDAGGALIRTDVDAKLDEAGARAELYGVASVATGQHVDNHLCVDHAAADTRSSQIFRSIVDADGRAVFNGKVIVRPDSQRIDASQQSDNLLLSPRAEVDTKPELEIYADDVRCSHGATVGEIDEGQLFYLCSRGIAEDDARRLIMSAFSNTVLERVRDLDVRRHLAARISGGQDEACIELTDELWPEENLA